MSVAATVLVRDRRIRGALLWAAVLLAGLPVLAASGVAGFFREAAKAQCATGGSQTVSEPAAGGQVAAGLYAAPLQLQPGRWFEVGATEYGGPSDPSSGDYGAIPDPGQSYLPAHPDSFAELSVLDSNPADSESFSFQDADALDRLPYLTALRVSHDNRQLILAKRDIGYGQGPGQTISNGEPYRLDVWWQAAQQLGVSKSAVNIQLAPQTGAAATLGALASSQELSPNSSQSAICDSLNSSAGALLPLTAGQATKVEPNGLAVAGRQVPRAVKEMVAAGNRLDHAGYLYGGAHGTPLSQLQPAYDCSSAVSYLLYWAGLLEGDYAEDSTDLEAYGLPGPGRWISIYANAVHTFIFVGGVRFDTVYTKLWDWGPNSERPGPRWRVYPGVPDWSRWVVRHPPGL